MLLYVISTISDGETADMSSRFEDIYTLAYRALDEGKANRNALKAYKGSHFSHRPHQTSLEFLQYFSKNQCGLFSFAARYFNKDGPIKLSSLGLFDLHTKPRISVKNAFDYYYQIFSKPGETKQQCLERVAEREHFLGFYRGGSSGFEDESLCFGTMHFRNQQIPAKANDIMIFLGGFKGAVLAFCGAIMTERDHDKTLHKGGVLLVPKGYYQSLRLIPSIFGGTIDCQNDYSTESIKYWLYHHSSPIKAIYLPLINNENGKALSQEEAHKIAKIILTYNAKHPGQPAYVIADDVYVDSCINKHVTPTSIASVAGSDIGDGALGHMYDWSVSIVTSSKTFALPTTRISHATTGNNELREGMMYYRSALSQGRVPQIEELFSLAAICFTPTEWINGWNNLAEQNLKYLKKEMSILNKQIGFVAYDFEMPDGGWYLPLRISRKLLPALVSSSTELAYLLCAYSQEKESGIAALPGELFGYRMSDSNEWFSLRLNIANDQNFLDELISRLQDFAAFTKSDAAASTVQSKLDYLHSKIPGLKTTLKKQQF